ncbi:MAG: potassium-transporting ATPase subunit C [Verrucomicrobia bacterium]|jgi:potassium-transporting ATPase KdpC subunit|nr:potassium-transporting ATPase subunit C [Verrucomicrobiota bacterium]
MLRYLFKSILLLSFTVVIVCVIYPGVVWVIGQVFFPFQANGSLLKGPDGNVVGSKLIAQPFTKDEYFQPRPSAASYDASASASSTYAASNYLLRNRVATALGPIVKYKSGPKAGQLVGPDIEAWFQQDKFQGNPHIVAQWADLHNAVAQAWVNADPSHAQYVDGWSKAHQDVVADWIKKNPGTPQPKAADLAVLFFENFSQEHSGTFPSAVTETGADGKAQTSIQPVKAGSDIQGTFFDMWRQEHPDADLQDVPGDLVMASGSGLDPHITLENAEFQLERVAAKWADDTKRDPSEIQKEIEHILQTNASAPFAGLAGEKLVNVLEVNLQLSKLYGLPK